jgi:predicted nucleic acid-binding protein
MTRLYISDSNIWIDFRNAGLLASLFELPLTLCCTDFVLHELQDLPRDELVARGLVVETLEAAAIAQLFELMVQHNNSSLADVSCYLLAQQTKRPLLTGDGRLRRQAQRDGLEVHGALWLLDALVSYAVVSPQQAAQGLQTMLARGSRLPPTECETRLRIWCAGLLTGG